MNIEANTGRVEMSMEEYNKIIARAEHFEKRNADLESKYDLAQKEITRLSTLLADKLGDAVCVELVANTDAQIKALTDERDESIARAKRMVAALRKVRRGLCDNSQLGNIIDSVLLEVK